MAELLHSREGDRLVITLDSDQPVEVEDLAGSLFALNRMFDRHYRSSGPESQKLYITNVSSGSVILEFSPLAIMLGALVTIENAVLVADFANRLWSGIKAFSSPGEIPRSSMPSPDDAADIREFTKPLLGKRGAALRIKHARFERTDGSEHTVIEYDFDETELNRAAVNIENSREFPLVPTLESHPSHSYFPEVMLFFDQANRGPGKEKGRTGDKAIVPQVYDKPLPVYFRDGFQNLKDFMTKQAHPLTSAFVVDLYAQIIQGIPRGYIVTNVHRVIPQEG